MRPFPERLKELSARAWPTASVRVYLAAVMVLAILPMACFVTYQLYTHIRAEKAGLEAGLTRSAAAFAQSVEREVKSSIDALTVLSHSELFREERIRALGRLLQGRPRRDWDSIFLLDREGAIVLDTAPARTPADTQRLKDLHQLVSSKPQPVLAGLAPGAQPGTRAIALALPILHNRQLRYVLGVRMSDSVWQRLAAGEATSAKAALFDDHQLLIGYSDPSLAAGARLPAATAEAMKGQPAGFDKVDGIEGQAVYAAWDTVPAAGWRVQVAVPAAPIDAARRETIASALSITGALLLAGLLLAGLAAHPIASTLRALAKQKPEAWPDHITVREIALLRDAIRNTPAGEGLSDEYLKRISHELRTPLGAISAAAGVLEVAQPGSPDAVEAQAVISRQAKSLAYRMNELLRPGKKHVVTPVARPSSE
ncbi:MAG TPA: histidine kinase dimerization/phospho-acceptor domain-containing protein [Ramlibacter sp.]|nr:histidine kinase dimerization/phospho-acceptor domain-containing protein [Ramlibacter sp.]